MALICPNLSDNDVAADFQAIVDKTNENIAYNLWNKFEGDIDAIEDFIDAEIAKFTPKPMVSREAFEQSQHDPLINLASKWGLNNEGFSNPSVSHSQLEKEAKELGLGLKKATSGSYYLTKNGKKINPWRDAYQLAKEPGENPVQELQDKLTRWAEDHGIEVTTMEDLIQRMKGSKEYSDGVIGVADIANKLIGLAEGKISIDTLPEEVSHFIVNFMINDPSIQRALEQVVNTDVYQQVKEDYKDIYTTEEQFQKEALGKILAAEIVNQFKGKSTQETGQDQTIYNRVKMFLRVAKDKFIQRLKSLFNRQDARAMKELRNIVDPLAKRVLEGKTIQDTRTEEQIAEATEEYAVKPDTKTLTPEQKRRKRFLENTIKQLDSLLHQSRIRKGKARALSVENVAILKDALNKGIYTHGIHEFLRGAKAEINDVQGFLKDMTNLEPGNISNYDKSNINYSYDFIKTYKKLLNDIHGELEAFRAMHEDHMTAEMTPIIKELQETLTNMEVMAMYLQDKITLYASEKGNLDEFGEKINPDYDASKQLDPTKEDIGWFRLKLGAAKNSSSTILKIVQKTLNDKINNVARFTKGVSKAIMRRQKDISNFDSKEFFERDSKGNRTGYIISEFNQGAYNAKMRETVNAIAKEMGYENYGDIIREDLTEEQDKRFNEMWAEFYKNNTQQKKKTVERGANRQQITVFETLPAESYRNPAYAALIKDSKKLAYINEIMMKKEEALNKTPIHLRTTSNKYLVPQMRKSLAERMRLRPEDGNFLTNLWTSTKESLIKDVDDTMFGQDSVGGRKIIPIFFNQKLDNIEDLTYDLSYAYTKYAEMAENYQQMNQISGEMEAIRESLNRREYKEGIGKGREAAAVEQRIETLMLGVTKTDKGTYPLNDGREISYGKLMNNIQAYFRNINLAWNFTTAASGLVKGNIDSMIEGAVGQYTTKESKLWARGEWLKNFGQWEYGNTLKKNKMNLMMEHFGIFSVDQMAKDSHMSRAQRKLMSSDVIYAPYMAADYYMKGVATLAILNNTRLIDGRWMSFQEFKRMTKNESILKTDAETKQKWKDATHLYDAYEVKNNEFVVKEEYKESVTEATQNKIENRANHLNHILDGTVSVEDKADLNRSILGGFLLMHRGWVISGVDNRFKGGGYNYETGEYEVGYYRGAAKFLFNYAKWSTSDGFVSALTGSMLQWSSLNEAEKRAVYKTALDYVYVMSMAIIGAMLNIAADDDKDDYSTQYAAYQMNRILLEMKAFWDHKEFIEMLKEPVVAANAIQEISEIGNAIAWGEDNEIERGMYKGWSKAGKWWLRRTPLKTLYELGVVDLGAEETSPAGSRIKSKNRFIKTVLNSRTYNYMKDKKEEDPGWSPFGYAE